MVVFRLCAFDPELHSAALTMCLQLITRLDCYLPYRLVIPAIRRVKILIKVSCPACQSGTLPAFEPIREASIFAVFNEDMARQLDGSIDLCERACGYIPMSLLFVCLSIENPGLLHGARATCCTEVLCDPLGEDIGCHGCQELLIWLPVVRQSRAPVSESTSKMSTRVAMAYRRGKWEDRRWKVELIGASTTET